MHARQRLTVFAWCTATMASTLVLSHGHLIVREILAHWPEEKSWEGRFENALYMQGALGLVASAMISSAIFVRSHLQRATIRDVASKDRQQRERHERQAILRHEEMMETLSQISGGSVSKKLLESGGKPR